MKKIYFWLLVIALIFIMSGMVSAEEEVLWWYENATTEQEEALENSFIDRFNNTQDQYQLEITYDANLDQNLRSAMLAGSGPDIVMTAGVGYAQEYMKEGYLKPLDDYAEKYGWNERFLPIMIDLGSYDGHLYSLPKTYESMVLFYNKTLFEENGWEPPETREDLDNLVKAMEAQNITPFAQGNSSWRGNNEHYVGVFLNHYAGPENVYKALNDEIPWTSDIFVESLELLDEYFTNYFDPNYYSLANEDFVSNMAMGRSGMSIIGTWGFQWMNDYFGQTGQEWDWAPLPSLREEVPFPLYDLGIGTTLSINTESENPDGAAEVLNFLTSDMEVISDLNRDWPGEWNMPVTNLDEEMLSEKVDPRYARHMDRVAESVKEGNYAYTTWTFFPQKTMQYIIRGIEQVWGDEITVEEYVAEIDEIFQEEYDNDQVPPLPER